MKKLAPVSAAALAAALLLAGCGADTSAPESSPAAESMGHHGSSNSPDAAADHNSADTMFAQMMIPHHEQAVTMSAMMLAKEGPDPRIVELATDIKAAQGPEIQKMDDWLAAWGEPREMSGHHEMDGMLSNEDLATLEAAQGMEAAKLFLAQMIEHHEGAVKMAEEEAAAGSNPGAVQLAEDIVASQNAEIAQMQSLLQGLA